jgi:hypothetical protein
MTSGEARDEGYIPLAEPEDSPRHPIPDVLNAIIDAFSACLEVAAIVLGGSQTGEAIDTLSDHDMYIFTTRDHAHDARRQ